MKIKCPCCNHSFAVTKDNIFFDYLDNVNYDDSEKYVWENLPILKSSFIIHENLKEEEDN